MKQKRSRLLGNFLFVVVVLFCSILMSENVSAGGFPIEKGALGDESWTVKEEMGKIFYYTHGTTVWGHEFGCYKDPNNRERDILWLAFSSMDEKIKDFKGQFVTVLLDFGTKRSQVELKILYSGTIGSTHVIYLSNWLVGEKLMELLMAEKYVKVSFLEPKELEVLFDIKEDSFSLEGFAESRKKAKEMSKNEGLKDLFLTLSADKKVIVEGEEILVDISLYVTKAGLKEIEYPRYKHEGFKADALQEPAKFKRSYNDIQYDVLEFQQRMVAESVGEKTIGPATIKFIKVTKEGQEPMELVSNEIDVFVE